MAALGCLCGAGDAVKEGAEAPTCRHAAKPSMLAAGCTQSQAIECGPEAEWMKVMEAVWEELALTGWNDSKAVMYEDGLVVAAICGIRLSVIGATGSPA